MFDRDNCGRISHLGIDFNSELTVHLSYTHANTNSLKMKPSLPSSHLSEASPVAFPYSTELSLSTSPYVA